MNHVYRTVFNRALGVWQVVSEIAGARGKGPRTGHRGRGGPRLLALLPLSLWASLAGAVDIGSTSLADTGAIGTALPVGAGTGAGGIGATVLPSGGKVSAGSGSIASSGAAMTVTQQSRNLAIDWQSFDIGESASVDFVQPDSSAIALNRVLGSDTTRILGRLTGNGQVWILNPNGVLFGNTAQVSVGGLVASTLGLSDADFMAGDYRFSGSGGTVTNQGRIEAGYAALLGGQVRNEGVIAARLGTVALAAGNRVTLDFAGDSLLNVQVDEGALHALADNKGLLQADGGLVLMTARARDALLDTAVNNTGVVRARTVENREGRILLLGDMDSGTVNVAGTLDASAAQGDGGFIETSAAHVKVADSATVTTKAESGQSGTWLIDPNDFTIAQSGGNMTGAQVGNALDNNGNLVIQTATMGTAGGSGDIDVNDAVTWSSNSTLTLQAERSVNVNSAITATGSGAGLVVDYNQGSGVTDGNFYVNATVNLPVTGSLAINGQDYTLTTSLAGLGTPNGYYALVQDSSDAITATLGNLTGTLEGLGHSVSGIDINDTSGTNVGLFSELTQGSLVRNISIDGSVNGGLYVGLLAGRSQGSVVNAHSSGSANASDGVAGGLIGLNGYPTGGGTYVSGSIDRSSSSTTVTSTNSTAGGLVGSNYNLSTISHSYATGDVTSKQYAGGLAGTSNGTIANSYATGNVSASVGYAGGLTSSNIGEISNSYATGTVTGASTFVGGLVARNYGGGTIESSYASGKVNGSSSSVGGLVGWNQSYITNSYWDSYTTGQSNMAGTDNGYATNVSAVTSDPTQSAAANYAFKQSAYANFDFGSDWFMVEGSSRPMLRAFLNQADGNGLIAVTNLYQLQGMAANLAGSYVLTQDIDASATAASTVLADVWGGKGFAAIGTAASKFTGRLDGQGHVIDGLTIRRAGSDNIGLFGYADGASFANVGLTDADVTGRAFVGTLLGRGNYVTIDNAWSSGTLATSSTNTTLGGVGGLAGGVDNSTIANSHSSASVHGFISVGGLVGQMGVNDDTSGASRISNSYTTGDVIADSGYGGGLVGRSYAHIANSHATGDVSGDYAAANGISALGGLVGFSAGSNGMSDPQYLNVYATGDVTGTGNSVGGLIGLTEGDFTMHNAFATGNVQGNNAVGGLIGRITNSGDIFTQANLYSVYTQGGTVTGNNFVGGLIGQSFYAAIFYSYVASGAVTGTGDQVGGVIGGIDCTCNAGAISKSEGVVWNYETTGQLNPMGKQIAAPYDNLVDPISWTAAEGPDYLLLGTKFLGANTAQMMTLDAYKTVGWFLGQYGLSYFIVTAATAAGRDYSDSVYLRNTWFLYEGDTYPLLRAFLTKVTVSANLSGADKTYDGSIASGTVGSYSTDVAVDSSQILGTLSYATSSANAGTYSTGNGLDVSGGLYSGQLGYEIAYSPDTRLTIAKADATVTANSATTTYDGTAQSVAGWTVDGLVNGEDGSVLDDIAEAGGSGRNAGSYAHTVSGSDNNYNLAFVDGSLTIGQAAITVSTDDVSKTYDGTTSAAGSAIVTSGQLYGSDSLAGGDFAYTDKNAGTGKTVTVSGVTVSDGNGGGNYAITYADNAGSTILQKALTIGGTVAADKAYDGTATASLTAGTLDGLVAGETLGVSASGEFDSANAGSRSATAHYTLSDGSGLASNYTLADTSGHAATIAQKALTISGTVAADKTYDGTATASLTAGTLGGLVAGETLAVGVAGEFDSKDAGSRSATAHYTLSDGSGLASNYTLADTSGHAATIARADATVTANSATVTYNGSTQSVSGYTASGLVGGEDESVLTGVVEDGGTGRNAGSYAHTVSGSDGNYNLSFVDGALAIEQAALTVSSSDVSKTYDGTTSAAGSAVVIGGQLYGSDSLSGGNFAYTDKNAGSGKTVTVNNVTVDDGNGGGNYAVTYADNTGSSIDKANATVTANSSTVTYNGSTQSVNGWTVEGLVGGEDPSVLAGLSETGGSGRNAGSYDHTLSGSDGNYSLTFVDGALTIEQAALIVSGVIAADKVYDGTTTAVIDASGAILTGLVAGDDVSIGATGEFADKNAGTGITVNLNGSAVGADAGNYVISNQTATTADITRADATVTANSATVTYNGSTQSVSGYTASGLVGGEDESVLTGVVEDGGTGRNAGSYAHTVSGSDGNYNLSFVDGALAIEQAALTVSSSDVSKTYDGTTSAAGSAVVIGGQLYGSDSLSGGNFAYTDKNAGSGKTVTVNNVTVDDGNGGGNYAVTYADNTGSSIDKATLTVSGSFDAADKAYDGTASASILDNRLVLDGVIDGDAVAAQWVAAFGDAAVGPGKTVTLQGTALDGGDSGNYTLDMGGAPTATASILPVSTGDGDDDGGDGGGGSGAHIRDDLYIAATHLLDSHGNPVASPTRRKTPVLAEITVQQCGQNLPAPLTEDCQ